MPQPQDLMGFGMNPQLAGMIGNTISTVVATGTTLVAAAAIPGGTDVVLINGQSGQTGVAIPAAMMVGDILYVKGIGATAPVIWAPAGTSFNAAADNTTGLTLSAATASGTIIRVTATKFYSFPLAP